MNTYTQLVLTLLLCITVLIVPVHAGGGQTDLQFSPFANLDPKNIIMIEVPLYDQSFASEEWQNPSVVIEEKQAIVEIVGLLQSIPFRKVDEHPNWDGIGASRSMSFYFYDGSAYSFTFENTYNDIQNMITTDQAIFYDVVWKQIPAIVEQFPYKLNIWEEFKVDNSLIITRDNKYYKEITNPYELDQIFAILEQTGPLYLAEKPDFDKLLMVIVEGTDVSRNVPEPVLYDDDDTDPDPFYEYKTIRVYYTDNQYYLEAYGICFTVESEWGETVAGLYAALDYPEQYGFNSQWMQQYPSFSVY